MTVALATLRPPFLLLTVACVALGAAAARGPADLPALAVALAGALAAHAAVNALNEYLDFASGLDRITARTAFSGGSGALPAAPRFASLVLAIGIGMLLLAAACAALLAWSRGPAVLAFALPGAALVVGYTPWITRRPLLCLGAPGLAFGPLMVPGVALVAGGTIPVAAWAAAAPVGLAVSNLLLANQVPDRCADARVGRRTVPVVWGVRGAGRAYTALLAMAVLAIAACAVGGWLPAAALVVLPVLLPAGATALWLVRGAPAASAGTALAANALSACALPLALAAVLWLA